MRGKRKILIKIEITLLVFLAALTALTLAFAPERAEPPSDVPGAGEMSGAAVLPAASDTPKPTEAVPSAEASPDVASGSKPPPSASEAPPPTPKATPDDRYITLNYDEKNIGSGDLILVNSGHYYEIPEDGKLVLVGEHKSRSYVLLDAGARLAERIMKPLNTMMDDFYAETGLKNILLNSAFRTLKQQQAALDTWIRRVGPEEAKRMASSPGYSEHHTGLAFDLAIYSGDVVSTFKGTGKYAWIHDNAYKYGFVLRYLENKQEITGTAYEPWHFRYIGVPHAYFVTKRGYAYEEYMEYLMCFTLSGTHLFDEYEDVLYEIYYVPGTKIPVPRDSEYTISGNNIDGFIVTVKLGKDTHRHVAPPPKNLEVFDA